ncbi:MAG: heme o synthase [Thermoplasmata archaeon]
MRYRAYFSVTKPATVALLLFTSVAMMLTAHLVEGADPGLLIWVLAVLSVYLSTSGTNAVTCYIDRDVDRIMRRTERRPIPCDYIRPDERAAIFGVLLIVAGLILAVPVGLLFLVIGLIGAMDTIFVYSYGLKRRTPWNIILGGFGGGLPALGGWVAVTGSVSLVSLLAFSLVVAWIPGHIWSLALLYKDDYSNARIPMLPLVTSVKRTLRCIASTVLIMFGISLSLAFLGDFGLVYTAVAVLLGIPALALGFLLVMRPTKRYSRLLFKFSSPYLFLLFLAMIVDALI